MNPRQGKQAAAWILTAIVAATAATAFAVVPVTFRPDDEATWVGQVDTSGNRFTGAKDSTLSAMSAALAIFEANMVQQIQGMAAAIVTSRTAAVGDANGIKTAVDAVKTSTDAVKTSLDAGRLEGIGDANAIRALLATIIAQDANGPAGLTFTTGAIDCNSSTFQIIANPGLGQVGRLHMLAPLTCSADVATTINFYEANTVANNGDPNFQTLKWSYTFVNAGGSVLPPFLKRECYWTTATNKALIIKSSGTGAQVNGLFKTSVGAP